MSTREEQVYQAKLAEQAERYDEMATIMCSFVEDYVNADSKELGMDERNLLSVAFKNSVSGRRASWRIISSVHQKEKQNGAVEREPIIKQFKQKIEDELNSICTKILNLLDNKLIKFSEVPESKVFYYKMKGDYERYKCEFAVGEERNKASREALQAYQTATDLASEELSSTHPIRLGLALNYSVFHYEIMNQPQQACEMAKKSFDDAITEFDTVHEESYKDSTLIMQLLRDNLTLWTSDLQQEGTEKNSPSDENDG